jgi:hypothetical protein
MNYSAYYAAAHADAEADHKAAVLGGRMRGL